MYGGTTIWNSLHDYVKFTHCFYCKRIPGHHIWVAKDLLIVSIVNASLAVRLG